MMESADELLRDAVGGDAGAFQRALELFRPRLKRCIALRMDPRLSARFDASDVAQEAITQAWLHRDEFAGRASLPLFCWVRQIACRRLIDLHRVHLGAKRRSVLREVPLPVPGANDESFDELSHVLADSLTGPSRDLEQQEMLARVRAALNALRPTDREILVMRHLEQMSIDEIANALQMTRTNVSTRHLRAVQRLHDALPSPPSTRE